MSDDPLVMYLIVRESLLDKMSASKIAAQVGHAVQYLMDQYWDYRISQTSTIGLNFDKFIIFSDWRESDGRKVILKADDKEWEKLKELDVSKVLVVDNGLTQIDPGSETVIGLMPMLKSARPKLVKRLQAL